MDRSRRRRARLTHGAGLCAVALLYGCAGAGPPPQDPGGQYDQIQRTIFDRFCLDAGCHNPQARAGSLDLSPGVSYDNLVNVVPNNPVASATGLLRVQPFQPANSFLLIKLTGPGPGEGTRMPQGKDPLSQTDIDSIQSWIVAGAPRGGTAGPTATPTEVPPTATDTIVPSPTATPTITPTPVDTATPTATVTGSAPPTSTATVTPTVTPSPSPSPTATVDMFTEIQTTIFNTTCVDAFCHDTATKSGNLTLVEGLSYANLVGVTPQNAAAVAAGYLRVDPFNPDNSFLLVKVTNPTPLEGNRMPLLKPPLSATQIELIRDWIAAGAQP
jgi:hypothetical protein